MIKNKDIYRIILLLCIVTMPGVTACTDGSEQDTANSGQRQLNLMPYPHELQESPRELTRALPDGYIKYTTLHPLEEGERIIAFIAPQAGTNVAARIFSLQDQTWKTNLTIEDAADPYYIYGFMPVGDETSTDISISQVTNSPYKDGAKLMIKNLNTLSTKDPCVIVGVKKGTGTNTSIEDVDIRLGEFSYQFNPNPQDPEYAYLLFDHLFGAFQFQMKMAESYAELRTIKVKSIKMKALTGKSVNAEVVLHATTDGTSPLASNAITFTTPTTGESSPITLYQAAEGNKGITLSTSFANEAFAQNVSLCYAPTNIYQFELTTTYDVYVTNNMETPIRENCKAVNTIKLGFNSSYLVPSHKHSIQITVNPTYLYALADPDLNDPTFSVTTN